MSPDPDRTVERLLKRSLRATGERATDAACLDAETLAAWADGGLSARDLSLAEVHLAECAHCRAMVAAIARSTPPPPVADHWWQRRWTFAWLVPLTAGAAAVALWVAVPRDRPSFPEPRESAAELSRTAREKDESVSGAPAPGARLAAPQALENGREKEAVAPEPSSKAPPPPPDAARQEARAAPDPRSSAALERLADTPSVTVPPPAALSAPAGATVAAPSSNRAFAPTRAGAAAIETPDPKIRWRLGVPGVVQRSTDGGASWADVATGVTVALTAGAAPSTSVCWIVGRQGTVLRTTDGRRWQQIPFPSALDLVAVRATDASSATITTADGRSFHTADGGISWTPSPRQEF